MTPVIHSGDQAVTLIGGAPIRPDLLDWALSRAPVLVAADGGAKSAVDHGHRPRAVIGDMDSLDRSTAEALDDVLHEVTEQDSTDFEKCLSRIRAPAIVGLGFLGARLDHTLAALTVMHRIGGPCLLVGREDAIFSVDRTTSLAVPAGTRISLWPIRPVTGRSRGLHWPIDGIRLEPWGRIGTSNVATGPVRIDVDGPGLAVILPVEHRDAAWEAVTRETLS